MVRYNQAGRILILDRSEGEENTTNALANSLVFYNPDGQRGYPGNHDSYTVCPSTTTKRGNKWIRRWGPEIDVLAINPTEIADCMWAGEQLAKIMEKRRKQLTSGKWKAIEEDEVIPLPEARVLIYGPQHPEIQAAIKDWIGESGKDFFEFFERPASPTNLEALTQRIIEKVAESKAARTRFYQ